MIRFTGPYAELAGTELRRDGALAADASASGFGYGSPSRAQCRARVTANCRAPEMSDPISGCM
jgi:hypothetical protein